jgi:hypothetical protein
MASDRGIVAVDPSTFGYVSFVNLGFDITVLLGSLAFLGFNTGLSLQPVIIIIIMNKKIDRTFFTISLLVLNIDIFVSISQIGHTSSLPYQITPILKESIYYTLGAEFFG